MSYGPGQTIGSYKLLHLCGSGAYGSVYYAENIVTHHFFALKILNASEKVNERELRGLSNYKNCRHPNLLQIHHIEKINDVVFYTMDAADNVGNNGDYIPDTLSRRLEQKKTLPVPEILKMANELLEGLSFLHKHGLVHRDIKPDNILWIDGKATLADIGLTAQTDNGSLAGTPGFISDSLLRGKKSATPDDDLYALGKVIYCALTGCSPCEYPHYPENITISEAGPLIKTYTSVCDSPSNISSSEDMKKLLNSQDNSVNRTIKSNTRYKLVAGIIITLVFGIGVSYFYPGSTEVCTQYIVPSVEKEDKAVDITHVPDSGTQPIPSNANIISDLELIYENRSKDPAVPMFLKRAQTAFRNLDLDVEAKLRKLNKHKMNHKSYIIARNAIFQAKREHIAKDVLCQLALKEKEIQKFLLTYKSTDVSDIEIKNFKKLLDDRYKIIDQLTTKGVAPQKKRIKL